MGQREHSAEQKSRAVLELLQGDKSLTEIAGEIGVTPKTIDNWRKEFLSNASRAFTAGKDEREARRIQEESEARERSLAEKVGLLTVELDWLKKKAEQVGLSGEKRDGRRR